MTFSPEVYGYALQHVSTSLTWALKKTEELSGLPAANNLQVVATLAQVHAIALAAAMASDDAQRM